MSQSATYFDSASSSGTGGVWQDTYQLDDTYTTRVAYCTYSGGFTDLLVYTPIGIAALADGTRFTGLTVGFDAKVDNAVGDVKVRLEGTVAGSPVTGTEITSGAIGLIYATHAASGNASYWGVSGTTSNIFSALRDGTLKLRIDYDTTASSGDTAYLRNLDITVFYTEVDTKRAASVICCP